MLFKELERNQPTVRSTLPPRPDLWAYKLVWYAFCSNRNTISGCLPALASSVGMRAQGCSWLHGLLALLVWAMVVRRVREFCGRTTPSFLVAMIFRLPRDTVWATRRCMLPLSERRAAPGGGRRACHGARPPGGYVRRVLLPLRCALGVPPATGRASCVWVHAVHATL